MPAEETIPRDVMNRAKNISKISPFPVHVVKLPTGKFTTIQTSGLKRNNKGTIVAAFQYGIATNLPTGK
jgi:hypothetical protein